MPRLSRLSLLLLLPLLAGPARAAGPALEITATDPGLAARLGNGQSFSVRIAYRSDQPLRFELQTFDGTEQRRDMNNPKPLYAAGTGEAIAWIAFRRAAWIDRIQVVALSADWRVSPTTPTTV